MVIRSIRSLAGIMGAAGRALRHWVIASLTEGPPV